MYVSNQTPEKIVLTTILITEQAARQVVSSSCVVEFP